MDVNSMEWNILIALFKSTVEQKNMLTGIPKQQSKLIFNRWKKEGEKLLKLIEEDGGNEYLEEVTEVIENAVHELRTNKNNKNGL
jgi:hypothetical protein